MNPSVITASVEPEVAAALVTAASALLIGVLTGVAAYVTRRKERQRELHGKAYKAAMAWHEMLYRVRRRADGDEVDRALIDRFHELQEEIAYHQGWIGSESRFMARSYCRLVKAIKTAVDEPVRLAWQEAERRSAADGSRDGDIRPDCSAASDRFLFDVRWHLSVFSIIGIPRWVVAWRNRKEKDS